MDRSLAEESKPILLPAKPEVPRRPKREPVPAANGHDVTVTNGVSGNPDAAGANRKRTADEADIRDELLRKRAKVPEQLSKQAPNDDVVVLDDAHAGAILIDDD